MLESLSWKKEKKKHVQVRVLLEDVQVGTGHCTAVYFSVVVWDTVTYLKTDARRSALSAQLSATVLTLGL
jgi:hypothetical protein